MARLIFVFLLLCHYILAEVEDFHFILPESIISKIFNESDNEVCNTYLCWLDEQNLKSSLNESIHPCDNFYEFVCGGWIEQTEVPETETKWDSFRILQRQVNERVIELLQEPSNVNELKSITWAKDFYKTCINIDDLEVIGTKTLNEVLESFGGWPMISRHWNEEEFNWEKSISNLYRLFGLDLLIGFSIEDDLKNKSIRSFTIGPTSTIFPNHILRNPTDFSRELTGYAQWILFTAEAILENTDQNYRALLKRDAYEIVNFEMSLSKILDDATIQITYHPIEVNKLQRITDFFDTKTKINWKYILMEIFKDTDVEIALQQMVVVKDFEYLRRVLKLLDKTPKRVLANYVGWKIVHAFHKDTTLKIKGYSNQIDKLVLGFKQGLPIEEKCKDQTETYFSRVISYLYINEVFNKKTKREVEMISETIRESMGKYLEDLDWMDEETKLHALQKVLNMKTIIGYVDGTTNPKDLENLYENLIIGPKHLKNILFLKSYFMQQYLNEFKKVAVEQEDIFVDPTVVNAFNYRNTIYILAGIINYPFYENCRLRSLNYGSLGFLVGHEMVHSFDNNGRQLDKNGNLHQWWNNQTLQIYEEKVECFIDFYNNLTHLNYIVNGFQTVDENIADIIGLKLAYRAFIENNRHGPTHLPGDLRKYSSQQLFFISFAKNFCEVITPEALTTLISTDSHTPNPLRVIGSLSNLKEFSEAFQCQDNSFMNPRNKCEL